MSTLPPLRDVIDAHGLRAKKSLGQNFLLDLNLTRKIARAAGNHHEATVLEIGPGPGGLTRALLAEGARKVIAVEKDERCLAALQEISAAYPGRLDVIPGDALSLNESDLLAELNGPIKVVANLPYNIGTALLIKWVTCETWPPFYEGLTLMFQKEVAQRIVAQPGDKHFGRLSVICGWRTEADLLFEVPRQAFTPPPKVTSAIVRLTPRAKPLFEADLAALEQVVAAAFGQRRKMLRQSLKSLGGDAQSLLETTGIDPTRRAETLTIEEFCALARSFASHS
ncbi:MAG: 16S rRNA (adenine(1518)-N(6)/adenine(1519)-N(6))-dimethyltransferase RsmA [Alphaproteobacteria bacterium]|nr:MAG: 16S rRNA (adenine(1518)-N(6)/adenine(1519)-N(6))-dimethyltransferase RsmA [Alphaproteobacteria bacterium]